MDFNHGNYADWAAMCGLPLSVHDPAAVHAQGDVSTWTIAGEGLLFILKRWGFGVIDRMLQQLIFAESISNQCHIFLLFQIVISPNERLPLLLILTAGGGL